MTEQLPNYDQWKLASPYPYDHDPYDPGMGDQEIEEFEDIAVAAAKYVHAIQSEADATVRTEVDGSVFPGRWIENSDKVYAEFSIEVRQQIRDRDDLSLLASSLKTAAEILDKFVREEVQK